jgi:hypothetical protein
MRLRTYEDHIYLVSKEMDNTTQTFFMEFSKSKSKNIYFHNITSTLYKIRSQYCIGENRHTYKVKNDSGT